MACTGDGDQTIDMSDSPDGITFDSDNGNIYVANFGSNAVSVIDGSTNTIRSCLHIPLQARAQQSEPKANIINGKYLSIKDPKFREESGSYSITGTIVNNSTRLCDTI
jgi:hypothetical protein